MNVGCGATYRIRFSIEGKWSKTAVWLEPVNRLPGHAGTGGGTGNGLRMALPENAPRTWRDIHSLKIIESQNGAVILDGIFAILPTGVLTTAT